MFNRYVQKHTELLKHLVLLYTTVRDDIVIDVEVVHSLDEVGDRPSLEV